MKGNVSIITFLFLFTIFQTIFFFCGPVIELASAVVYTVTVHSDNDCSDNDCTLEAALTDAASNGDPANEIRIAQGSYLGNFTYLPTSNNNSNLSILGGWSSDFSTRTVNPENTVIEGNATGSVLALNEYPPANIISGSFKIEGITVRNGNSTFGGGIFAITESPGTIEICRNILETNTAISVGGGCALLAGNLQNKTGSTVTFHDNIIRNNRVTGVKDGTEFEPGEGGGCDILATEDTRIGNNLFYGNRAGTASTYEGLGGGLLLSLFNGTVNFVNNTITDNRVYMQSQGNPGSGGGVLLDTEGDAWGGTNVTLANSIIYGNTSESPQAVRDIANAIDSSGPNQGSLTISYCDYGELSVTGVPPLLAHNLRSNPKFSKKKDTLYYLTSKSRCVDAGDNGAFMMPAEDLAGQIRPQDGNNDGTPITNMGCFEQVVPATFSWTMFVPAFMKH